ncbi:hypothetical protein [Flavimarina sp. Hel_I_48]|uniref:hypothetical protein n=1 Tax=Flavimarina sp. Hel_I_48 TaxID=1392488 RepID=UPI0006905A5A|nr:hypothetical protein [Flavimarina sp. Hel_I_48]
MALKTYFIAILGLFSVFSNYDEHEVKNIDLEMIAQTMEYHLVLPDSGVFKSIDVPKKNFIIKRGGIADMDTLHGVHVIIKEEKKDGKVTLARKDGKHFFNAFPVLHADLESALATGELVKK